MVTKWYEFLDNIRDARAKLNDPKIVWYRGHSSAAYSLLPSIHRVPDGIENDRMLAQRGAFTIHGHKQGPIEVLCPDVVSKVTLPVEALDGAREFLEHSNLNAYSIYPDIVGMARHIRNKHLGQ